METQIIRVLLIEDNQEYAQFLQDMLSWEKNPPFEVKWSERLEAGLARIAEGNIDVILLDLSLPGTHGLETFHRVYSHAREIPIIILSGSHDESLAPEAVKQGAQDYLVKGEENSKILSKVMRYAISRKKVEEEYQKIHERFSQIYNSSKDAMGFAALDGVLLDVNDAFLKLSGYSREELLSGKNYQDIIPTEYHQLESKKISEVLRMGESAEYEKECVRKDGSRVPVLLTVFVVRGMDKKPVGLAIIIKDMTKFKQIEIEKQKLSLAVEQSPVIVMITDTKGNIEYVNPKFTEVTGYTLDEVKGKNPRLLKSNGTSPEIFKQLWETISQGGEWRGEFRNKKKNGELYWELASISSIKNPEGKMTHFLAVKEDITRRKWAEEAVVHMAYHDSLTDLPNRFLIEDRLVQALSQARHRKKLVGIMMLGLDRFKSVNDTLGHVLGDQVLQAVGKRLSDAVHEKGTVARIGGDEYMLLLPEVTSVEEVVKLAQQVIEIIRPSFHLNEQEVNLTASLGVSVYPNDGDDAESLLKDADTALGRAKQQGRNNYQLYTPSMHVEAFGRMVLENSMRKALSREEFIVHYQPLVDIRSRHVIGMEALVRWQHPDIGLVSPVEFIPIAEGNGLIIPIGEWVLRTSCSRSKAWQDGGFPHLRLAVNLSARQFQHANLLEMVEWILKDTGFDPHYLEFEITEGIAMENVEYSLTILRRLKEMGIQISIDDFGTGYSSLNYLKEFPIDTLKIDRSFIQDLTIDPGDAAIVSAIIVLAHSLKLKVTAEGVETQEQLDFLRKHKCDIIQGYLFSKPVPADQFEALIMQNKHF